MTDAWTAATDDRVARRMTADGMRRLVVVAAHPDDETLAAGAFLRAAHRAGVRVELVVATDGEAALPEHEDLDRAALAGRRRAELDDALDRLGLAGSPVHRLGLPDSALDADELALLLGPLLDGADACLAPWRHDPHPDHAAAGRATTVAAPAQARRWQYPVWMWSGLAPDDPRIDWSTACRHDPDGTDRDAKRSAIAAFVSQTAPLVEGGRAVLDDDVLARFRDGPELFFRDATTASAPIGRFDDLYRDGADPWGVRTRWYERRKQAVLLACLPRERYRHAAEPGCGLGELTRDLADRCDRVDASDPADAAVRAATTAVAGRDHVRVARCTLPDPAAVPDGVDLVVCSEVLYYLSAGDVTACVDRIADALVPGGDLVLAHWSGWPAEAPADAATVHARIAGDPRFGRLVEHEDDGFLLHVLRRR